MVSCFVTNYARLAGRQTQTEFLFEFPVAVANAIKEMGKASGISQMKVHLESGAATEPTLDERECKLEAPSFAGVLCHLAVT